MNDPIAFLYQHAWEWFKFHADQRVKAFNVFLLLLGAVLAGIGYISQTHADIHSPKFTLMIALVSLFGALISIVSYIMEIRNTELVECGRGALDELETAMSEIVSLANKQLNLTGRKLLSDPFKIREHDTKRTYLAKAASCKCLTSLQSWLTHKFALRLTIGTVFAASCCGLIWSIREFALAH